MFDSAIYGKVRYHQLDIFSQAILHYLYLGNETNSAGLFRVNLADLAQHVKLESIDAVEERLILLQRQGFIQYDQERELVYVKDLAVTNSYHTREMKSNISSMFSALRAAQGSPLLQSYYDDHKSLIGSKVFQQIFHQLKTEKLISD